MLDWNEIDTVFLDMDGTLLDLHFDNYFWLTHLPKRYAEIKQVPEVEARQYLETYFRDLKGTLNWYCFDYWSKELDIDLVSLKHEVAHKVGYRPHAQNFLKHLSDSRHDLVLVTNSHRAGIEIKLQVTNLADYISEIFTSHDFGIPKENPKFWQAFHQARPFDMKRTVLFDDNEDVLNSARTVGFKHLINIAQPDSRGEIRSSSDFPLLASFQEVFPNHG